MKINMKLLSKQVWLALTGVFFLGAPAYSHWGAASPWTFAGQTNFCTHGSSTSSNFRKVRLQTIDVTFPLCFEGYQCFPYWLGHDAVVVNQTPSGKSNSGKADIFIFGHDNAVPPGSFLPYIASFNDLARNASGRLSSSQGKLFVNLQASCQSSDNML
jgi:hypothetical protein